MAVFDTPLPDSDLACRRYQRGDLSHAIMAENKGDDDGVSHKRKHEIKGVEMKVDYNKSRSLHRIPS